MTRPVFRHWCGQCQFKGLDPFMLGTVQAESQMEAVRLLEKLWREIVPCDPPSIVAIPGLLAFHEEDAA